MTVCTEVQAEGRKAGLREVFRALLFAGDHTDVWDPESDLALRELVRDALWLEGRTERNFDSPGSIAASPPRVSIDSGCGGSTRVSTAAAPGDMPAWMQEAMDYANGPEWEET